MKIELVEAPREVRVFMAVLFVMWSIVLVCDLSVYGGALNAGTLDTDHVIGISAKAFTVFVSGFIAISGCRPWLARNPAKPKSTT